MATARVKGLLYLLIIGVVVLIADIVFAGLAVPPERQAPKPVARAPGRALHGQGW